MNPSGPNQGQPISYKTNVNRAKTKRWVDAKSYSYDGDDWGDADEHDEYGGYGPPEPVPQKPTGFRQAGPAGGRAGQPGPPIDTSRNVSQPPYQQSQHDRTESFGRGSDRRAFSGPGGPPGPPSATSPTGPLRTAYGSPPDAGGRQPPPMGPGGGRPPQPPFYQHPGQSRSRPSFEGPGGPHSYDQRGPPVGPPRGPNDGYRSQSMTSNSSDFAHRRDGPGPGPGFVPGPGMPQPMNTGARPPRKSSLSQGEQQPSQYGPGPIARTQSPAVELDAGPVENSQSPPPTIVRPADIYKRMNEEREKERLSQDSSRPSLEAITGQTPSSRDQSPANASETISRRRSPVLDTVAERRSEYGMDNLLAPQTKDPAPPVKRTSGSPILPQFSGFDGFGDDFGSSFFDKRKSVGPSADNIRAPIVPVSQTEIQASKPATANAKPEKEVQREPSVGFTSVVHQAFDRPAVPETPSSESGSGIGRSNSESTSVISPIISRGPSTATVDQKAKEAEARDQQIPPIEEEPSSGTPRGRSLDSTNSPEDVSSHPPGFVPGHRRNMSTPSPDNSPARTPALESVKQLRNPQEIELSETTPSSATHSSSTASKASKLYTPPPEAEATEMTAAKAEEATKQSSAPTSRSTSPSKGRVREIADQINSRPSSRQGSQDSVKDLPEKEASRPSSQRLENFRPNLPGGWNSYTTNTPPGTSDGAAAKSIEPTEPLTIATGPPTVTSKQQASAERPSREPASHAVMASTSGSTVLAPSQEASLSSIMPTPQGMADGHDLSKDKEYFPVVPPLKSASRDQLHPDIQRIATPPQRIPTMSTDPSPSDQESDRLRKQLVRELSPGVEELEGEPPKPKPRGTNDSKLSASSMDDKNSKHESTFLPSEYESYWNSSSDPEPVPPISQQTTTDSYVTKDSPVVHPPAAGFTAGLPTNVQPGQPGFIAPQSHQFVQSPVEEPMLRRKFSWEADLEENFAGPSQTAAAPLPPPPPPPQPVTQVSLPEPKPTVQIPTSGPPVLPPTVTQESPSAIGKVSERSATMESAAKDAPHELPSIPPPTRSDSATPLAPEALPANEETTPVNAQPPPPPPSKPGQLPVPPLGDSDFRPQAFKEILALKTADERIKMFNQTRTKFSTHRVGLDHWLVSTMNKQTEHVDLLSKGGSIATGARPPPKMPSGPGPSSQPPYYQQYLNAANPVQPVASTPSPSSGSKITSQQVQAKGKDLLKGAGVLGGKANVAAKGLFAKGRKKFGGGDKATSRTPSATFSPTKHKPEPPKPPIQNIPFATTTPNPAHAALVRPIVEPSQSVSQSATSVPLSEAKEKIPPKTPPGPWKLFPTQVTPQGRASPTISNRSKSPQDQLNGPVQGRHRKQSSASLAAPDQHRSRSASNVSNMSKISNVSKTSNLSIEIPSREVILGTSKPAQKEEPKVKLAQIEKPEMVLTREKELREALPLKNPSEPVSKGKITTPEKMLPPAIQAISPTLEDSPTMGFIGPNIINPKGPRRNVIEESTPTQADFPPSVPGTTQESTEFKSLPPLPPLEQPKRRSEALSASPGASKRDSLVLDETDSKRTSVTDALVKQLPKPSVDFPRQGPSLAAASAASDNTKDLSSPIKSSPLTSARPFSFIGFGEIGATDLSLNNPLTPESEKALRLPTTVSEESSIHNDDNEVSLLADKDLESEPVGDASANRNSQRSSGRVFEEPDIQSHPAFRQENEGQPKSLLPQSRYSTHSIHKAQEGSSRHRPSHSAYSGYSGYSGISGADRQSPGAFPPRSASKPQITSQPSQESTKEKGRRRSSFFSSISGHSDKSKRLSKTMDPRPSIDAQSQPQRSPLSPLQQQYRSQSRQDQDEDRYGIQQSAYDPRTSVDQNRGPSKPKGHRRLLSGARLLNLGGGGSGDKSLQPTPPTAYPVVRPPEKQKKRRFSGFTGFFSRPPQRQATVIKSPHNAFPNGPASAQYRNAQADHQNAPYGQQISLSTQPGNWQGQQFQQKPYEPSVVSHRRQSSYISPPQSASYNQQHHFSTPRAASSQGYNQPHNHERSRSYNLDNIHIPHSPQQVTHPQKQSASKDEDHSSPSYRYQHQKPLDGYSNLRRSTEEQHELPQNKQSSRSIPSHSHKASNTPPVLQTSSFNQPSHLHEPQSPWERFGGGMGAQIPQSSTPPPPPPPPKDENSTSPQKTKLPLQKTENTVHTSIMPDQSSSIHTHTETKTDSHVKISSSTTSGQQSTPSEHDTNHEHAHNKAHGQALRQNLPPLRTTSLTKSRKSPEVKSTPVAPPQANLSVQSPEEREQRRREIEMGSPLRSGGAPKAEPVDTGTPTPLGEGKHKQVVDAGVAKDKDSGDDDNDEKVEMSSTAYPGQEWRPDFLGDWDGQ